MARSSPSAPRYRFVIYALLLGLHLATGMAFLGPASLLPLIIDDYGLTRAAAGFVVASMTLMVTLFSIPAGIVVVRWRLRPSYGAAWLLLGAGALIPFLPGFLPLVALRLVQGLGAAVLMPLAATILMRWAPEREFPVVNTGLLTCLTIGLGSSLLLGPPLAALWTWRWALGAEGILALAGAVAWFLLAREAAPRAGAAPAAVSAQAILGIFRRRATWLLSFAVVGPWALYITLSSWLPTYYTEARGLGLGVASFTAAVFTFAGIPAAILGGLLTARTGRRRPFILWPGLLLGAGAFGTFLFPPGLPLYAVVVATGLVQWVYEPAIFTVPMELPGSTPERAAAIWAAMLTAGNASSFLAPPLVGFLTDTTGSYIPGFSLAALGALTLFVAGLLLPETGPGRRLPLEKVATTEAAEVR